MPRFIFVGTVRSTSATPYPLTEQKTKIVGLKEIHKERPFISFRYGEKYQPNGPIQGQEYFRRGH